MKATINLVELKEEEIDFSKTQLVIDNNNVIVLVTGDFNNDIFKGVLVSNESDSHYEIGKYSNIWLKNSFKKLPSNQSVTLQND